MNLNQNPYQPYPTRANGITWVQGIEGAKAYQLLPNSNAMLLDSENDGRFYIKVSDNVGMCTLRTFKYEEIKTSLNNNITTDFANFVQKDELNSQLEQLRKELQDVKQFIQPTKSTEQHRTLITE